MAVKTIRYEDLGLQDPMAIIGFPSVGLVSSIMANYYAGQLKMTPVAGFASNDMPPYSLINQGMALPPVRVYGRKATTKTGRDVLVCLSEYAPKPEQTFELAQAILAYLKYMGVKEIVCLDGIAKSSDQDVPVICGSGPGSSKMIKKSKLTPMENGMVRGMTGVILYEGREYGMDVVAMMVPANPSLPDPGAAVSFIDPISSVVKGLRVNPKPLMAEAEEISRRLEEATVDNSDNSNYYG